MGIFYFISLFVSIQPEFYILVFYYQELLNDSSIDCALVNYY